MMEINDQCINPIIIISYTINIESKMKNILKLLTLISCILYICSATQSAVNYSKEPYAAYQAFFGNSGVETPDACGDKLKHITSIHDPILNRNVFVHTLHRHGTYQDSDRCQKFDRQRVEVAVNGGSKIGCKVKTACNLVTHGNFTLKKILNYQGDFCHVHQIKLDGANVGNPALTITLRKDKVQLDNMGKILSSCALAQFTGNWIKFHQKITYGKNGCLTFTATRMKDNHVLMSYVGCGVVLDDQGLMIRPKFGFYRSLADSGQLRDQSVRFVDLCIGQGDSCHIN